MEKTVKLYKGYINYYIVGDSPKVLKTYHFEKKTKAQVEAMDKQFQNPLKYEYKGMIKTKHKD